MKKALVILAAIAILGLVSWQMVGGVGSSLATRLGGNKQLAQTGTSGRVLAATDTSVADDLIFQVNIPAVFNDGLLINGSVRLSESLAVESLIVSNQLSAPNVIYTLGVTGTGLEISGDQDLLIENTDPGSAQKIFGKIKVGGDTITAGTNTDTFELVAGDEIGVSLDTSNKKITITNTYSPPTSAWVDSGTSVYLSTLTDKVGIGTSSPDYSLHVAGTAYVRDNLVVDGDTTLNGNVTLGDSTSDNLTVTGQLTSGTAILPDVDLGADLGSASLRFNNLYVANLNTNSGLSTAGQSIFTYEPTTTAYTQASVMINPTSPVANGLLLGLGVAGYERAGIDEDGDLTLGYNDAVSAPASDYPLNIYGHSGTRVAYIDENGNANFSGTVTFGGVTGNYTQGSLIFAGSGGALTQDNSNLFWDDTNNRLGIGTTSPDDNLEVYNGTAKFTLSDSLTRWAKFDSNSGTQLELSSRSIDSSFITFSGGGIKGGIGVNNSDDKFYITDGFFTSGAKRLTVDFASGNVGIGTSTPTSKLHVSGGDIEIDSGERIGVSPASAIGSGFIGLEMAYNTVKLVPRPDSTHYFNIATDGSLQLIGVNGNSTIIGQSGKAQIQFPNGGGMKFNLGSQTNEIMRISSTGLVGIGTTSPTSLFHLEGATTGKALAIFNETGNQDILTASASGTTRMVLTNAGNLGIGTTNPNEKLSVVGTVGHYINGTSSGYNYIKMNPVSGSNVNAHIGLQSTGVWNSGTLSLGGFNASTGQNTSQLVLAGSGNVGIGTTSPQTKLQVHSTVSSGDTPLSIRSSIGNPDRYTGIQFGHVLDTMQKGALYFYTTDASTRGQFRFALNSVNGSGNNVSTSDTRMTIDWGGNVGIGTTTPTTLLDLESAAPTLSINASTDGNDASIVLQEAATTKWSIFNDGDDSDTFYITDAEGDQGVSLAQGATSWAAASDITLKENVKLVEGSLDKVKQLNGYYYNFIGGNRTEVGLVAQEVQTVLPELVVQNKNGKLAVMYDRLAPVLVNAIKEQQVQIDSLGNLTTIETRLAAAEKTTQENKTGLAALQQVVADLFKSPITFLSDATFRGWLFLNPNQTGIVEIPAGATTAKVTFKRQMPQVPVVTLTPHQALQGQLTIQEVTDSYFVVELTQEQADPVTISWLMSLRDASNSDQPTVEISGGQTGSVVSSPSPAATSQPSPSPIPSISPSPVPSPDTATPSATTTP